MAAGLYTPYAWQVRHFNDEQIREASLFYSPEGHFLGFYERLPDTWTSRNLGES